MQLWLEYANDYRENFPYYKETVGSSSYNYWYALRDYGPAARYELTYGTPGQKNHKKAPLFYCPMEFKHPRVASSTGQTFYVVPDCTYHGTTQNRWFNLRDVRKPAQKFIQLEIAKQSGGIASTRYYKSLQNVFPHLNAMNAAHFDGHVKAYHETLPHFAKSTDSERKNGHTTANTATCGDYWNYTK